MNHFWSFASMRPEQTDGERSYLSGCGGLKSKLRMSNGIYRAARRVAPRLRSAQLPPRSTWDSRFQGGGGSGGGGRSGSLNGENRLKNVPASTHTNTKTEQRPISYAHVFCHPRFSDASTCICSKDVKNKGRYNVLLKHPGNKPKNNNNKKCFHSFRGKFKKTN